MSNFDSRFNPLFGRPAKRTRRYFTGAFLKLMGYRITKANVNKHLKLWWHNLSSNNSTELRLSIAGRDMLIDYFKVQQYVIKFSKVNVQHSRKTYKYIDQEMYYPYFIDDRSITTFSILDFGVITTILHRIDMYGAMEVHRQNEEFAKQFEEHRKKYDSWTTLKNFSVDISVATS